MCGRGTFMWSSGERYDGEWRDGKEEGRGTFTWPDGSYFDGNWTGGVKHGVGIWAPPLAGPADAAVADAPREAVLREYDHGTLVREELVPAQQRPVGDPVAGRPAVKTRKVREVRMGETIFKGAPSYDLMLQLQLGVRWSVGRITPERPRELCDDDFRSSSPLSAVSARFPRAGSSTTPPHAAHDFKWKDYCPMAFRKLRERFGIDAGEYMLSLCGACCECALQGGALCGTQPHASADAALHTRVDATRTPRRHGAARAVLSRQVRQRVLPVAGRALHREDDAQS
jgi:1-phosphatidylinositol-4-phosphate 5-kinase